MPSFSFLPLLSNGSLADRQASILYNGWIWVNTDGSATGSSSVGESAAVVGSSAAGELAVCVDYRDLRPRIKAAALLSPQLLTTGPGIRVLAATRGFSERISSPWSTTSLSDRTPDAKQNAHADNLYNRLRDDCPQCELVSNSGTSQNTITAWRCRVQW